MSDTSALLSALRNVWSEAYEAVQPAAEEARRSPHVEAVIEAVERALAGRAPLPSALTVVAGLKQRLAAVRQDLEQRRVDPQLTPAQRAIGERVARVYSEEFALLEEMEGVVRSFQRGRFPDLVARLRRATGELYRCQDSWEDENRESARSDSDAGMVMIPSIYSAVYDACDRVARGQIPVEEWLVPLDALQIEVEKSLRTVLAGFAQLAEALRGDALCGALAGEVQQGFVHSLEALQYMRHYASDPQVEFLDTGWTRLMAATTRLQRAIQRIGAGEQPYTDVVELDAEG